MNKEKKAKLERLTPNPGATHHICEVLTSVAGLDPALELLDLGVFTQHLTGVGLHPALVVLHVPDSNIGKQQQQTN